MFKYLRFSLRNYRWFKHCHYEKQRCSAAEKSDPCENKTVSEIGTEIPPLGKVNEHTCRYTRANCAK